MKASTLFWTNAGRYCCYTWLMIVAAALVRSTSSFRNVFVLTKRAVLYRPPRCSDPTPFRGTFEQGRVRLVAIAASAASSSSSSSLSSSSSPPPSVIPVPVTLLSGFLGTGKTTTLKHLLENTDNLKIAVVVNDVASVNIDAKLITKSAQDMVELQNGCACCSLADELFLSVERLLATRPFDAVLVELSGVADPMAIRNNWKMAPEAIQNVAKLQNVVTVVDAASFGTDYMTWDQASEREGWVAPGDDCTGNRKVAELLAEQVEAANLILLNKVDLANPDELRVTTEVVRALNAKADIRQVQFGRIAPRLILGGSTASSSSSPVVDHDDDDDHCADPTCTDHSHAHTHDHAGHDSSHAAAGDDHGHHHHHADATSSCSDPVCTDPTHSHEHDSHSHSTSLDQLGIGSYVYRASKPFNPVRLMDVLNHWPIPLKDTLDAGLLLEAQQHKMGAPSSSYYERRGKPVRDSPFVGVIRSKGFCWMAPNNWSGTHQDSWRHDTAMYWSHAGKHFAITSAGKWWGTIPKESMQKFFIGNMDEYERIVREDFVSDEFGDRRQELVFIGIGLDEAKIQATLDACLYTDDEMKSYRQKLRNYMDTILTTSKGAGLFDVDRVDQFDTN